MLQARHFDLVIDLQGLFKSAVMAYLTGAPEKIGYCEMREGSGLVSRAITGPHAHDHVIERYLDVARYLGAKVDQVRYPMPELKEECLLMRNRLIRAGVRAETQLPYVVLVPGARWVTKRWPSCLWTTAIGWCWPAAREMQPWENGSRKKPAITPRSSI